MKDQAITDLYDDYYAREYNEKFVTNPFLETVIAFKLNVLRPLIDNSTKWLDVACGTGYILSQFKGVTRGGFDLSPSMLAIASRSNPDCDFFKLGSFKDRQEDLENQWSLVSCMWGAYCYVDSIHETKKVLNNMISWIADGGTFFLQVLDIEDLRPCNHFIYEASTKLFGGVTKIPSITWTYIEDNGKVHNNLVSPHILYVLELIEYHFETIEVHRFRPYADFPYEKLVVARGKRSTPGSTPANISWLEKLGTENPGFSGDAATDILVNPGKRDVPVTAKTNQPLSITKKLKRKIANYLLKD